MVSKSGARLLDEDAIGAVRTRLVPLATVITPNVPEAEVLLGRTITTRADLAQAARDLVAAGAVAALVKGGHLPGPATDVLFDGERVTEFTTERIDGRHTHGTGCTLSAAIAARLALGDDLVTAVRHAKDYVTAAIRRAPGLGQGHGPLGHRPVY
jgi:hydroxymethylpyrimidine/phosphomethylpyrimidine kinase